MFRRHVLFSHPVWAVMVRVSSRYRTEYLLALCWALGQDHAATDEWVLPALPPKVTIVRHFPFISTH